MPGSAHGYDVVDPTAVIRGARRTEAWARCAAAREGTGLALVVDIVPNHVGVADRQANPALVGRAAARAAIGVRAVASTSTGTAACGQSRCRSWPTPPTALARPEVDGDVLRYDDHVFPIAPGTGAAAAGARCTTAQHYQLVSLAAHDERLPALLRGHDAGRGPGREDREVFDATHAESCAGRRGLVDGLRVDHPDGLADPAGYLTRLREHAVRRLDRGREDPAHRRGSCRVLAGRRHHRLRRARRDQRGVRRPRRRPSDRAARARPGVPRLGTGRAGRTTASATSPPAPLAGAAPAGRAGRRCRRASDVTARLPEAGRALLPGLPLYLPDPRSSTGDATALADARAPRGPTSTATLATIIAAAAGPPATSPRCRVPADPGAVMAKGVEDTAFYRYPVRRAQRGGRRTRPFGVSTARVPPRALRRTANWPPAMTTLSTHDTKRGEDVRARIGRAGSSCPALWAESVDPEPTGAAARAATGRSCRRTSSVAGRRSASHRPSCASGCTPTPRRRSARPASSRRWTDPDADFERRCTPVDAAVRRRQSPRS